MGLMDPVALGRHAGRRPKMGLRKPIAPFLHAGSRPCTHVIRW